MIFNTGLARIDMYPPSWIHRFTEWTEHMDVFLYFTGSIHFVFCQDHFMMMTVHVFAVPGTRPAVLSGRAGKGGLLLFVFFLILG